ncbi:MAG: hypothetical protein COU07_00475 [Candidatus Harrisonbacteria bacterium CG10_big_fil_rev_8_21_14_0_10_40_38]|uniref:POTRA domain-containing protein n=1 Tax=Candidatus Harrisonbacteria bacterium CG10_big_fil_rev_8_21_14_0_10_40_38 TaxID=1974583 RepID=A0A2H0USJ5_9BACT|nr:MAG: hypothetical protein COU07_00475 [Candidatus Harrisonbacteria bacterium CG10_big_fil_rev_8_21_14_0_10_40_38]
MSQPQRPIAKKRKDLRWFKFRLKFYALSGVFGLILIGVFYLFRYTPMFQIKSIGINGADKEESKALLADFKQSVFKTTSAKLFGTDSYFAVSEEEISTEKYESIKIDKKLFKHEASITVVPRNRLGIWCREGDAGTSCWFFDDKEGIAIEETLEGEGHLIIKIVEKNNEKVVAGETLINKKFFERIKKIIDGTSKIDLDVKRFEINTGYQEFSAIITGGAKIIFSLRFDPEKESLSALSKILNENSLSSISYIDLSVENKLYIKRK